MQLRAETAWKASSGVFHGTVIVSHFFGRMLEPGVTQPWCGSRFRCVPLRHYHPKEVHVLTPTTEGMSPGFEIFMRVMSAIRTS